MAMSMITAPGFIDRTISSLTTIGARPPGHQHRADHQVGLGHGPLDRAPVRGQRRDAAHLDLVDVAQPVDVLVEQVDLGLEAGGHPRRVPAHVAGAEHDDPRRTHAGGPAEQHAPTAVVAFEEVGADLHAHAAGDLAHGGEEGQRAVGQLHGLVGDGRDAAVDERLGHRRVGGEVEVGEQHQTGPEVPELGASGSFTLQTSPARSHTSAAVATIVAPARR